MESKAGFLAHVTKCLAMEIGQQNISTHLQKRTATGIPEASKKAPAVSRKDIYKLSTRFFLGEATCYPPWN